MSDKMREEFEAWYLHDVFGGAEECRHYLRRDPDGGYRHASLESFWKCWQASRSAVVVDLGMMTNNGFDGFYLANQVKRALRDAGVSTK